MNKNRSIHSINIGGEAPDAISPGPNPTFMVFFQKAGSYPPENFSKGIKLMSVVHQRFLPRVKSLSYFPAVVSLQKAKQTGASELLYISESGDILEGGTVNFFGVYQGKLYTAEENILWGITRHYVIELAKKLNIEIILDKIPTSQIKRFDEAFITSTTREVMPGKFKAIEK